MRESNDTIEKARTFLAELDSEYKKDKQELQDVLEQALNEWRQAMADADVNTIKRLEIITLISEIKKHPFYKNKEDDSERMIMELENDLGNIRIVEHDSAVNFLIKTNREKLVPIYEKNILKLKSDLINQGIEMMGNFIPTSLNENDDRVLVRKEEKYGFLNLYGKIVISLIGSSDFCVVNHNT